MCELGDNQKILREVMAVLKIQDKLGFWIRLNKIDMTIKKEIHLIIIFQT